MYIACNKRYYTEHSIRHTLMRTFQFLFRFCWKFINEQKTQIISENNGKYVSALNTNCDDDGENVLNYVVCLLNIAVSLSDGSSKIW